MFKPTVGLNRFTKFKLTVGF